MGSVQARRVDGAGVLADLLTTADDAIDDLEEALFLLTLLPADGTGPATGARPARRYHRRRNP